MFTRVAAGRARVVREVRAAAPLMTAVRAPVTARGPWLTAVLNAEAAGSLPARWVQRPLAVVVQRHREGRPGAVAFLARRRRGPVTEITLLGAGTAPLPDGRPAHRLLVADDDTAVLLARGIVDLLGSLHGPWLLRLAGLPLGDPTLRVLAEELPDAVVANVRSRRLVDELDGLGSAGARGTGTAMRRSRDPRWLERWLPALLSRLPDACARRFLRSAARLHAVAGELELAVVTEGPQLRAALLTLADGVDRWPWWGFSDVGGLRTEMGEPLVGFTARGGPRTALALASRPSSVRR